MKWTNIFTKKCRGGLEKLISKPPRQPLRPLPTKKPAQRFEGSVTFRKANSKAIEYMTAEYLHSSLKPQRRKVLKVSCPRVAWAIALREAAEPNKRASHRVLFYAKDAKNMSSGEPSWGRHSAPQNFQKISQSFIHAYARRSVSVSLFSVFRFLSAFFCAIPNA